MPSSIGITFLYDVSTDEVKKISSLIEHANKAIDEYFGLVTSFDVLICRGSWDMEVQMISRNPRQQSQISPFSSDIKFVGVTDYRLEEIIMRHDIAKFGHYLHELIHGILSKNLSHQLKEGLAWYFTLRLTEKYPYVRPSYPFWIDEMYVYPTKRLAEIVGEDFLKDFAIGKASLDYDMMPDEIKELFMPAEVFYSRKKGYGSDG